MTIGADIVYGVSGVIVVLCAAVMIHGVFRAPNRDLRFLSGVLAAAYCLLTVWIAILWGRS